MDKGIRICVVGDIMPGGVYNGTCQKVKIEDDVFSYMQQADVRIATLESAIGNSETFILDKVSRLGDLVYSKDEDLLRLKELGIEIVSLANNHIFDLGEKGISHVIKKLDELGIKHFGAGENIEQAKEPAVFSKNGKTIAFVGFCDWRDETTGWCLMATEKSSGVNPLFGDYENQISLLKEKYDYVVVVPHWGIEHTYWPTNHVVSCAKKMIKAGADAVIGGHTHRAQPIIKYKNKIIAYSLGNFFFADRLINYPRSSWYPSSTDIIDFRFIDKTSGYPYVKKPTLVTFTEKDKDGEIVLLTMLDDKINAEYKIVNYDLSNTIRFNNFDLNYVTSKIYIIGILSKLCFYPYLIYPLYRFVSKLSFWIPLKFFNLFKNKGIKI